MSDRYMSKRLQKSSLLAQVTNLVSQNSTPVVQESTLVPLESILVPQESPLVVQESTLVAQESTLVPQELIVVPLEPTLLRPPASTLVPQESTLVPQEPTPVVQESTLVTLVPQGFTMAPQGVAPQGSTVAPQGCTMAPQGCTIARQGNTMAPRLHHASQWLGNLPQAFATWPKAFARGQNFPQRVRTARSARISLLECSGWSWLVLYVQNSTLDLKNRNLPKTNRFSAFPTRKLESVIEKVGGIGPSIGSKALDHVRNLTRIEIGYDAIRLKTINDLPLREPICDISTIWSNLSQQSVPHAKHHKYLGQHHQSGSIPCQATAIVPRFSV